MIWSYDDLLTSMNYILKHKDVYWFTILKSGRMLQYAFLIFKKMHKVMMK